MQRGLPRPTPPKTALPRRLQLGTLALLVCIPLLLYGMQLANEAALRRLTRTLEHALGVPVGLGSLEASLAPGFALHDLRIAGVLEVPRIDIRLGFGSGYRPRLRHLTIVRPRLELDLERWRPAVVAPPARRPARQSRRGGLAGTTFSIHEGDITLHFRSAGRAGRLHARHVFLTPSTGRHRLVAGETSVEVGGKEIATLASAAIDFDRRWRLRRGAALGGRVVVPGTRGMSVDLLGARLLRTHSERLRLRVEAEPRQRDGGRLLLEGHFALARGDALALRPRLLRASVELRDVSLAIAAPILLHRGVHPQHLRASGVLTARRARELWRTDVDVTLQGLRVDDPRLAPRALDAPLLQLVGRALYDPLRTTFALPQLRVTMGQLSAILSGDLAVEGRERRLTLDLQVPTVDCQAALASMPAGFVPQLEGMALAGQLGLSAHLELQPDKIEQGDIDVQLTPLTCRVLVDAPKADIRALVAQRKRRGPAPMLPALLRRAPVVPLARISPLLRAAFVSAEDQRFYRHHGFDEKQLRRAFLRNLAEGRFGRGASSISQQLVKNLYLDHSRTISRKLQEAVLTWRLEQVVDKRRILELYLNIVEMGSGVQGVEQASREYFGRPARFVDPLQAAHLAALTPSPRPLAQRFRRVPPGEAWRARLLRVLRTMRSAGAISRTTEAIWAKRRLDLRYLSSEGTVRRTIAAARR